MRTADMFVVHAVHVAAAHTRPFNVAGVTLAALALLLVAYGLWGVLGEGGESTEHLATFFAGCFLGVEAVMTFEHRSVLADHLVPFLVGLGLAVLAGVVVLVAAVTVQTLLDKAVCRHRARRQGI